MKITRKVKDKIQVFERKDKEIKYDLKKCFKFNSKEYEIFLNKCKINGEKSINKVIREMVNDYGIKN